MGAEQIKNLVDGFRNKKFNFIENKDTLQIVVFLILFGAELKLFSKDAKIVLFNTYDKPTTFYI